MPKRYTPSSTLSSCKTLSSIASSFAADRIERRLLPSTARCDCAACDWLIA